MLVYKRMPGDNRKRKAPDSSADKDSKSKNKDDAPDPAEVSFVIVV